MNSKGLNSTIIRDVPAFGAYFAWYELIRQSLENNFGMNFWASSFVSGGVTGALTWALVYPIDVAKTIIQTVPETASARDRQLVPVMTKLYKKGGLGALYRGLGTTVVRALPVNAVIFPVYEYTIQSLQRIF